jgi:hypothetical protein
VADGLSQILQHEVQRGALKELHVCRRALSISHLLFVDDTLLFLEVTEDQALVINNVLRLYEWCTWQLINLGKCSMMFGANCLLPNQEKVKEILNVGSSNVEEKYLGLLTLEGQMNKENFKWTKEWLAKRFSDWAEKYMLTGAKEVLIKSVAQAIPMYIMGLSYQ